MSVAHPIERLLLVLTISNLQNTRVSHCLLIRLHRVLLESFFVFHDMGLPSMGGIFH
jgi:hypothetical protein